MNMLFFAIYRHVYFEVIKSAATIEKRALRMCFKKLWRSSDISHIHHCAFPQKRSLKALLKLLDFFWKRAVTANQQNAWTSVSGVPIDTGQVGRLTHGETRLWVRRATVKWIAAGTTSHSREALRQGWIERHKERLSGNRALLSGHRRGPKWRIITEELCATHTLTSLTVWYLFLRGINTYSTVLGLHAALFQLSIPTLFYTFSSTERLFFFFVYWFGAASLFPSCFKLRQVVFLLMFGKYNTVHTPREDSFISLSISHAWLSALREMAETSGSWQVYTIRAHA